MVALVLLTACGGGGEPQEGLTLGQAAEKVTLGTLAELGPCVLRSSARRTFTSEKGGSRTSEEVTELRWQDRDNWSWVHLREGRASSRVVVWEGEGWTSHGDRPLEPRPDAEPLRVDLALVWDPWREAASVRDQLSLVAGEVELYEGRRVLRHTLELVPLARKARRTWTVDEVLGTVWIDEATALRLQADLTVRSHSKLERQVLALAFTVSGIGADPVVHQPPAPASSRATGEEGVEPGPGP